MVLVVLNWSSWSDQLTSAQNPKPAQPDQNETVFPPELTQQTHMAYMLSDLRGNLSMTRILNAQTMVLYIDFIQILFFGGNYINSYSYGP